MFTLEDVYKLSHNITIPEREKLINCLNKLLKDNNLVFVVENNKAGYKVKNNAMIAHNKTEGALNDVLEYLGVKLYY